MFALINKLSIGQRLIGAFLFIGIVFVIALGNAMLGLTHVQSQNHQLASNSLQALESASNAETGFLQFSASIMNLLNTKNLTELDQKYKSFKQQHTLTQASLLESINSATAINHQQNLSAFASTQTVIDKLTQQVEHNYKELAEYFAARAAFKENFSKFVFNSNALLHDIEKNALTEIIYDEYLQDIISSFTAIHNRIQLKAFEQITAENSNQMYSILKEIRQYSTRMEGFYNDINDEIDSIANNQSIQDKWQALQTALKNNHGLLNQVAENQVRAEAIASLSNALNQETTNQLTLLSSLIANIQLQAKKQVAQTDKQVDITLLSSLIAFAFVMLVITVSCYLLIRAIKRPLDDLAQVTERMGSGDFTSQMQLGWSGEFVEVSTWINQVTEKTNQSLSNIADVTKELKSMAQTNVEATSEVKQKMVSQNAQLSDVTSAITDLACTSKEISSVTNESFTQTENMKQRIETGTEMMKVNNATIQELSHYIQETHNTMEHLLQDVEGIRSVLDVISSIADSTNLLALNAAIEAARAGENGRGFAVVADEVRTLSQRTAEQTDEIGAMIGRLGRQAKNSMASMTESRQKMKDTLLVNNELEAAFDLIHTDVQQLRGMSEQINSFTNEQESASTHITTSISELALQVQENVSTLEQLASGGIRLNELSLKQKDNIGLFTLA